MANIDATQMSGGLYARGVITAEQKQIISSKVTVRERMEFLLDIIIQSLEIGTIEKFKGLLMVMEESEDLTIRAVGQQLGLLRITSHVI